jgi:hypothetical protein
MAWLLALFLGMIQVPGAAVTRLPDQYWCPMHADERSEVRGKCAICGMALVPMPPAKFATYPVDLRVTPTLSGARLRLAVTHPATRAVLRKLAVVHERPLHLFVIGERLDFFTHEHPVQQPDGVFMVDVALPRQGAYMAIAEFLPQGATAQMFQQAFTTGEPFGRPAAPEVDLAPKIADGMRITVDVSKARSGQASALTFRVDEAVSHAPVTDLEPYLGAGAHLLIVPVDLTEAIHGHPEQVGGPALAFAPILPRPGRYKLWLQVQRRGAVSTVAFVLDVP